MARSSDNQQAENQYRIVRLETDANWIACRDKLTALEKSSNLCPWYNWNYLYRTWRELMGRPRCWMVEIPETLKSHSPLIGAALFKEQELPGHFIKAKSLCPFDNDLLLPYPPLLTKHGMTPQACVQMITAYRSLASTSQVDLIAFKPMAAKAAEVWADAISSQGHSTIITPLHPRRQLFVPTNIDTYLQAHQPGILADINKRRNRLTVKHAVPCAERVDVSMLPDELFELCLEQFKELYVEADVFAWTPELTKLPLEAQTDYLDYLFDSWRTRGVLDILYLRVGHKLVAFWVTLRWQNAVWSIMLGYDKSFSWFGVAKILLMDGLRIYNLRGMRNFNHCLVTAHEDVQWANTFEPAYKLCYPASSWKGRLWALTHHSTNPRKKAS